MFVLLHILAATTPKMLEVIPASDKPIWVLAESRGNTVRRQSFWYQSWFKLSESLAHLVNYTMLRACCDASVALRMSFV